MPFRRKACILGGLFILLNVIATLSFCFPDLAEASSDDPGVFQIEKKIIGFISSDAFDAFQADQRCRDERRYRIYVIDNFELKFNLTPEVRTSHGEMLVKLLTSGREDMAPAVLNTSLSKGLALVIQDLIDGNCVDAVISSTPGSNYTYDQIGSLFSPPKKITRENILQYRGALVDLMRRVAFHGFPSVGWLENADVNSSKLLHDARKVAFIEALGRFGVPVILPYGNADSTYKGDVKSVSLLSLPPNAKAYAALDRAGNRVAGFPYSPLVSGDEPAVYTVRECPRPDDPVKAGLDINNDGYPEYVFARREKIPFTAPDGRPSFAPPLLSAAAFNAWLARLREQRPCEITAEVVLTAGRYKDVQRACQGAPDRAPSKAYVWLNSPKYGPFFEFDARCRTLDALKGTSVIPPNKVRELLPPKRGRPPE